MEAKTRYRIFFIGVLVVLALSASAICAGGEAHSSTQAVENSTDVAQTDPQVEPDSIVMEIDLDSDGDATWTITYRTLLDDENTSEAFEAYKSDIEANRQGYASAFEDRLASTVRTASNQTGREMELQNVTLRVTTESLAREYGVIAYEFEWTKFGHRNDEAIKVGDAIRGYFLDSGTTLEINWPDVYSLASVNPDPDRTTGDSVSWQGARSFDRTQPRLVLTSSPVDQTGPSGLNTVVTGFAFVFIVIAGIVAYRWRKRESPEQDTPVSELLTDEERVIQLIEKQGGRVKQQQIAEQFDWTDAKTSQVVSRLRDSDDVETLRIGRENVVSIPDEGSE